jgi:hypothetical protein
LALNPVSLDDRFRPWLLAGVSYFLLPEGSVLDLESSARPATDRQAMPGPAKLPPGPQVPPPPLPSPPPPKRVEHPKASPATASKVNEATWPEPWRERLKKTLPAPLVWTYPELGEDLSGAGDKARSACLRQLIGSLALPKGSSAFWPLRLPSAPRNLPDGQGAQNTPDDPRYFQEGLHLLRPQAVILFGERSVGLSGLNLRMGGTFAQTVLAGVLYIVLPDFAALLANAAMGNKTSAYLRSSLSQLPDFFK